MDYFISTSLVKLSVVVFGILEYDVLLYDVHCGLHTQQKFAIKGNVPIADANTQGVKQPSVKPGKWNVEKKCV